MPRKSKNRSLPAPEEPPVEEEAVAVNGEAVPEDVPMEEEDDDEEGGIRIGDIYRPPPPPPACTFDSTGPRLIITHIENEFFKSYAGKQVLGPFHKSFTSIVGPNGSGKSNVIDSMLFVFGYRAQKIRSKKISVLIHNSQKFPNVQSCTVAVHFQQIIDKPGDDFEVVPNSQVVVSRTAFKDNSSYYQIDGKRCQFKAVAKVLRGYGIDLDHNRFLILQGEVEQIALMKPKALTEHDTGMLEFLEDIVGSSRYKEPIELLSKRVEELNEQRGEKLNRVKLVEKEKDELEVPKNEALSFLRLENEITVKKNMVVQYHIFDAKKSIEKAQGKKDKIEEGMSDINKQLEEYSTKRAEIGEKMKKRSGYLANIAKAKETCSDDFKKFEAEDVKLQEEMKHKNQKRKKLIAQVKVEKEKLEELKKVPEENEEKIVECEGLRDNLEEDRKKEDAAYHKAMATLNSETQVLQDEKAKYETKLVDLRKVVDDTKSVLEIGQSELDIYQSTEKSELKKLDQIKSSLEKANATATGRRQEIDSLESEIPDLESKIKNDQKSLQQVVTDLDAVENELKTQRVKLEESRSAMHSSKSRGRVLDSIMEQKRNKNIPGVHGRLGDLGGIDEKYDIAISTACGPLDNIVVDNVETGQKCINFLKKNNIGTATFIALDKQEKHRRNCETQANTPENVPRLFDLIKCNDDVKTAFYYGLRETLVAKDLDQASRIAYGKQRNRVVTLKGELIEPSGTMSGGGRSALRGRMGKSAAIVTVDPREVERTEENVEQLTQQAGQLRRTRSELEDSLRNNSKDLNTLKMNLKKFGMEVKNAEQQEITLKDQLVEQQKKVKETKSDPAEVAKMEKSIAAKQKVYEKAAKAAEEVESEVTRVHNMILEVTGSKTKGIQKKLKELDKKLEKVRAEITRLQVAIKTSKRNYTKTEEKIKSAETETEEVAEELKSMQEKRQKLEEEAKALLDNLNQITEDELKLTEKVAKLKEEHDALLKEENKIKSSKIEVDQQLQKYTELIKANTVKGTHWKKELRKLDLQEIPLDKEEDDPTELKTLEPEELEALDLKQLEYDIVLLGGKLSEYKPNLAVIQEYRKKEDVYLQRVAEMEDITKQRDEQRKYHEDLRKQRLNEFMGGYTIISNKLKEMYQMITLGGDAELELVDSLDPFSEGIVFSVRPPKKSWKNITNLSGGEKTLSSLALVFALHYYKPTPLYVMDEIDAALDFKNVSIVGNYIKERTKNAQFIIISLRTQMFELADRLVGIYKTYNCTKSVTVNPNKYGITAKEKENPTIPTISQSILSN